MELYQITYNEDDNAGAGRICTTAFTDEKAVGLDCDFPQKDFDYEEFLKRTK